MGATPKRKWKKSSEELVARFHATMESFSGLEHRKMFGYPCCFANGYLFTGLAEEKWILRLPLDEREAFGEQYTYEPFAPMEGRIMKEYVVLPQTLLDDSDELTKWLERSLDYVKGKPPKPKKTSKRKAK